jgi:type I restriction-modification system DNA methylase subunit
MQSDIDQVITCFRGSEPACVEVLVRQLKPILNTILGQARTRFNNLLSPAENNTVSKQALEAYNTWQALSNGTFNNPREEFCLQTAYLQFVRTFFVRICEDHGLISCLIADENLASTIKNTYLLLLEKLYPPGSSVIHFGKQDFFDWFVPDTQRILSLFHLLRRYDFKDLRSDILGRIYDEDYIENKGRSEKGQFYTPAHVVKYMLDTLGIPGGNAYKYGYMQDHAFLDKTIGDISCGSGSFLVAAAALKRTVLQLLVASHKINSDYALQIMSNTLIGFDLNPFACYLAEVNLLLQCLPFLTDERGVLCRSIEPLHIYCADVLEPANVELINLDTDQQQFDYLVGNPPYVSAGESLENLRNREKVSASGFYQLLHQRWDLFVPFFERNLQLLKPGGSLGLIVSTGIETEGYAEKLRQALCKNYTLSQIDFFPRLRLFQHAAVESTMVFLKNCLPGEEHEVVRRKHLHADCKHYEILSSIPQFASGERVFRWRFDPLLEKHITEGTIPLCTIAYIGTGIEAQSDEQFDPLLDGKRQKRFTVDDVFLPISTISVRPAEYMDEGVLGDDVDSYHLRRSRFVAYEKFFSQMRAPRHSALFRTPEKLLLGETSGGYYDRAGLFANHSVQVVVPWKALVDAGAIEEKGIRRVLRKSQQISGFSADPVSIDELFDLRYVLGIVNSRFMRAYITSNRHEGTRKGRIYPDVWKRLPIKVASPERQREIAMLVAAIQEGYKQLAELSHHIAYIAPLLINAEKQQIRTTIGTLLSQIEDLVVLTYSEPADANMIESINAMMTHETNGELF